MQQNTAKDCVTIGDTDISVSETTKVTQNNTGIKNRPWLIFRCLSYHCHAFITESYTN